MHTTKPTLAVDNGDTAPDDALFVALQLGFSDVIEKHCMGKKKEIDQDKLAIAEKAMVVIMANIASQTTCCLGHMINRVMQFSNDTLQESIEQFFERQNTIH